MQQQAEDLTGEEGAANPPPRGPSQVQAEVVSVFGTTSQQFIGDLMTAARRAKPGVTEPEVVEAMRAMYRPSQQSAGLWLKTVPEYLENGGTVKKPMGPVEERIARAKASVAARGGSV